MREVEEGNKEKNKERHFEETMKSANDMRERNENISENDKPNNNSDKAQNRTIPTDILSEEKERRKEINRIEEEIEKYDPHAKEIEKRANEGFKRPERGSDRSEFARQYGQYEHKRWQDEVSESEIKAGRKRGIDFDVEKVLKHPDGHVVKLDYVNYKTDVIIDMKTDRLNEDKLIENYKAQRKRHEEAYEYSTGRKLEYYEYKPYPSTDRLWSDDQNKK